MKKILFFILASFSASLAPAWTLNDVSILLPLPHLNQFDLLLGTQSQGQLGALLPLSIYKNLPVVVRGVDPDKLYRQTLKVVAIRIDPCFLERGTPMGCRHQIRLVWQPVSNSGSDVFAMDAAIHSFYDLTDSDWKSLIAALEPFASQQTGEALSVHPRIAKEGLSGALWTNLKAIVLRFAGEKNLSRTTTMTVDVFNSIWVFSGFDIKQGVMTRIKIPRTQLTGQAFFLDLTQLDEFRATINPVPEGTEPWMTLVNDSLRMKQTASEADIRSAMDRTLRMENPALEDTASTDCVSCHIAQTVRLWGERNTQWNWQKDFTKVFYTSTTANLKNNSVDPAPVNHLRAFGYFLEDPIISQRLINESAEVLKSIQLSESSKHQRGFR